MFLLRRETQDATTAIDKGRGDDEDRGDRRAGADRPSPHAGGTPAKQVENRSRRGLIATPSQANFRAAADMLLAASDISCHIM